MATTFDYTSRVPGIQGTVTQEANSTLGGIINNAWKPSQRLLPSGQTYLEPIKPQSGYPLYEYYKCYQLPTEYANAPDSILDYFANCGFNAEAGYTSSGTLYDAASVTASGSNYIVVFDNVNETNSDLVASLVSGDTIVSTWTSSGSAQGNYVSCSVSGSNTSLTLTVTSGTLSVGDNITLTFTDTSVTKPDITKTDPFVVKLYYDALFNSLNTNGTNTNFGQPNIYFSIMPDPDNSDYGGPTSNAFTGITAPYAIEELSSTSYALQIPTADSTSTNPVGYIPYSTLGTSSLSQAISFTNDDVTVDNVTNSGTAYTLSFTSANADISALNTVVANNAVLSGNITQALSYTNSSVTVDFVSNSGTTYKLYFDSTNSDIDTLTEMLSNSALLSGSITDTTASVTATVAINGIAASDNPSYSIMITCTVNTGTITADDLLTFALTGTVTAAFVSANDTTGTYAVQIVTEVSSGALLSTFSIDLTALTGSATGTISTSTLSGNYIIVTLINVSGEFSTSGATLTLSLDTSQTIFSFQQSTFSAAKIGLSQTIIPFYITAASDLTTKYLSYITALTTVNSASFKETGQGQCQLLFEADPSIVTSLPTAYSTLQAITGTSGNYQYVPIFNNYQPATGDVTQIPNGEGTVASVAATAIASNQYTSGNTNSLSPLTDLVLYGLNNDPDTALTYYTGSTADTIQKVGWNCVCIDENGNSILPWAITNQLKVNGSTDNALYPVYIWQVVDYVERAVLYPIFTQYKGTKQFSNNYTTCKSFIVTDFNDLENDEVLINVDTTTKYMTFTQNTTNPFGVDVKIPLQVYAAWVNTYYKIYLYSSTVTVTSTPSN
jgi:hypothetical protein